MTDSAAPIPLDTDAVVIGAGPAGLFQAFQLGLQGLRPHIVDALPHAGGQCAELYGDKPIYDVPGIPVCTGRELVGLLLEQLAPIGVQWHLGTQVQSLETLADGRFLLGTTAGTQLRARCVFIAAGVGAFVPRTLKIEGIKAHLGRQLHYHPADPEVPPGQRIVVHGGDEAAVAAAVHCADAHPAAAVTLLHRRDVFQAEPGLLARLQALRDAGRIEVVAAQINAIEEQDGRLAALQLTDPQGAPQRLALDQLWVYLGISPRLGPVADWGLAIERKQLLVDPASFATSQPGIYAVGDINSYPGKRRLILCAFHEATLAAFAAAELLAGDKVALQYTTTSARLHRILGVEHPGAS
ncbi:NAD(P)/FAD-dependent oxidoreductase [Comamonas endophytica]|uniref:Ferredoxin--NADP reductase n=1 Tax=Comamonas endophytica TaxID=2949090 RepID=A0ABY6GC28_9BURK|nr:MULTISPECIES: NAD(P)/FAD-dependent oxidoreductase [unclassified Acidovorax]MCD2512087.1 NAD(P)/FAD-dependent oxidoreductase [Acidovorax sp. D4N7]UYG51865.1 NAD(P)/FAD-dependent oxidoreductase [Acidovorax sp. 5MLIR]